MNKVAVVTGFVPIENHPRSEAVYHKLGSQLSRLAVPVNFSRTELHETWLHQLTQRHSQGVTHSVSDNPQKNTLAYHCVQHQKTTWMLEAARLRPESDVFVWIDYGIFHLPPITVETIDAFLVRVQEETAISIPGSWRKAPSIDEIGLAHPCWRFCGGTMVCHRAYLEAFDVAIRQDVTARLNATSHVSWEVNTWARVEQRGTPPIRWYPGDHDRTIFTGYASRRVEAL